MGKLEPSALALHASVLIAKLEDQATPTCAWRSRQAEVKPRQVNIIHKRKARARPDREVGAVWSSCSQSSFSTPFQSPTFSALMISCSSTQHSSTAWPTMLASNGRNTISSPMSHRTHGASDRRVATGALASRASITSSKLVRSDPELEE